MAINTSLNILPIQRQKEDLINTEKKDILKIDYSRDKKITDFGKATLIDRYLLPGEKFQDICDVGISKLEHKRFESKASINSINESYLVIVSPSSIVCNELALIT